jgi:hypothetical protein
MEQSFLSETNTRSRSATREIPYIFFLETANLFSLSKDLSSGPYAEPDDSSA